MDETRQEIEKIWPIIKQYEQEYEEAYQKEVSAASHLGKNSQRIAIILWVLVILGIGAVIHYGAILVQYPEIFTDKVLFKTFADKAWDVPLWNVVSIALLCWFYKKRRINKKILAEATEQQQAIVCKLSLLNTRIPSTLRYSRSLEYMSGLVRSQRVNSLNEAIALTEQQVHRWNAEEKYEELYSRLMEEEMRLEEAINEANKRNDDSFWRGMMIAGLMSQR